MKKTSTSALIILLLTACNQNSSESFSIENAWVREAPPNASMMAGYATIKNNTDKEQTLNLAKSKAFKMVEIHKTIIEDGVAKMRRQENLAIPAGGTLELKPGSYHLMLMHPNTALNTNDEITVTIGLQQGDHIEEIDIVMPVQKSK